tara:strand:+ start:7135 stop:8388 length:1254 start_codon:yes stop_codon:yes gene_type:complete
MTAGLSKNIMQSNIERIAKTEEIFANVEVVLTNIAYKQKSGSKGVVDLTDSNITDLSGDFLPAHTNFTAREIQKDPWEQDVHLVKSTTRELIWADLNGHRVEAPITTFLLVSAGPNRKYDMFENLGVSKTNPSMTANQVKTTNIKDESIVYDDIVVRFSNYDAMLNIWQRAQDLDNTVENVAVDYYKNMLDAFSPLIQLGQRDVTVGALDEDIFSSLDSSDIYSAFQDLEDTSNTSLTNEWNNPGPLNTILNTNFRIAKAYANEFTVAQADYSESDAIQNILDTDTTLTADERTDLIAERNLLRTEEDDRVAALNTDANASFDLDYTTTFTYPSFDAVILSSTGNDLVASGQDGLQNLGVTNIKSLDPFAGQDGELSYDYDVAKPNEIGIKRYVDPGLSTLKWKIDKIKTLDALGEL